MKEMTKRQKVKATEKAVVRIGGMTPYEHGFDAGMNGANMVNCHFAIFNSLERTREWERGNADGSHKREQLAQLARLAKLRGKK